MNNVTLVGNLATEPELRFTQNGTESCSMVVAINEKVGEDEKAHFVRVTAFGTLADNVVESLHKGQRVVVVGRLNTYSTEYELADGSDRRVTHVSFTASAIGPDLRWARAKVAKVSREPAPTEGGGRTATPEEESEEAPKPAARTATKTATKPARSKAAAATKVAEEPPAEDIFDF